jgi:hypothetical protein
MTSFRDAMLADQMAWKARRLPHIREAGWWMGRQYGHVLLRRALAENLWPGLRNGDARRLEPSLAAHDVQPHKGRDNLLSSCTLCANFCFRFGDSPAGRVLPPLPRRDRRLPVVPPGSACRSPGVYLRPRRVRLVNHLRRPKLRPACVRFRRRRRADGLGATVCWARRRGGVEPPGVVPAGCRVRGHARVGGELARLGGQPLWLRGRGERAITREADRATVREHRRVHSEGSPTTSTICKPSLHVRAEVRP